MSDRCPYVRVYWGRVLKCHYARDHDGICFFGMSWL